MKSIFLLLVVALFLSSCQNKKLETTNTDTVGVDTVAQSTAIQLAFAPLDNYALKNTVKFPDSVTFLIVASQAEFEDLFAPVKPVSSETIAPDFIINHTIAIAAQPSDAKTSIEVEKVELGESTINVFVKITKGEKGGTIITPARAFSVEKRDGVTGMDFYLNGKVVSSLMLPSF